MAKKIKDSAVIELEAIEEVPLDVQIDKTLQKHNVTAAVIAGLKEKYGGLKLVALDDKESFLELKQARKEVRQWGILCERITKKGREDAVAIQRKWLEKEKSVLAQIAEVQDPLDAEIKKYEDEQERLEQEEIRKKENAFAARQSQLIKMGATYLDGHYTLDHVSFEATLIKESDEDTWAGMLSKYQAQYEKNEAVKVEEEKRREAEAAALKQQQMQMEQQRKELEEQQRLFREQQEAAARQNEEIRLQREAVERERRQREEQEQRARAEEADRERRERIDKRISQLRAMGLEYSFEYKSYIYADVAISTVVEVEGMNDTDWDALIVKTIPTVERCKKEAEEKRQAEIKERERVAAEQAAQRERERIAEEQRLAKIKEDQETARKAEEAAKAKDSEKWQLFLRDISGVPIPEMKSGPYKSRIIEAKKMIEKMKLL